MSRPEPLCSPRARCYTLRFVHVPAASCEYCARAESLVNTWEALRRAYALALLLLAACSSSSAMHVQHHDAGALAHIGSGSAGDVATLAHHDAGELVDAGAHHDAGRKIHAMAARDAGELVDAGVRQVDAGAGELVDAGQVDAGDAGELVDAGHDAGHHAGSGGTPCQPAFSCQ